MCEQEWRRLSVRAGGDGAARDWRDNSQKSSHGLMWNPTLQSSALDTFTHTHGESRRPTQRLCTHATWPKTQHTSSCGPTVGVLQQNHYKTDGSWMHDIVRYDTQNTRLLEWQTQTFIKTPIDRFRCCMSSIITHKQRQVTRNCCRPSALNIHDHCRASLWLVNWCVSEINVSVSRCGYSLKIPEQTSLSMSVLMPRTFSGALIRVDVP